MADGKGSESPGLWGRFASVGAAAFAAACCLGLPIALATLTALGVGFLISDAFLIPLLVASLGWSVFLIVRQRRRHGRSGPTALVVAASIGAVAGLFVHSALVVTAIALILAAHVWDIRLRGARVAGHEATSS